MTRRIRIHLSVGDLLQLAGFVGACVAVGHLAGFWWGVLLAAVLVVVEANLSYGQHRLSFPLPNRQDRIRVRWLAGSPWRAVAGAGRRVAGKVRK